MKTTHLLRVLISFVCLSISSAVVAASEPRAQTSVDSEFHEITPSNVFAGLELLNRKLDRLLETAGRDSQVEAVKSRESGLEPMHVFQMHLACIEQFRAIQRNAGIYTMPLVVAAPEKYSPPQVFLLTKMLLRAVDQYAESVTPSLLPNNTNTYHGKTPTDVFQLAVSALEKILALGGTSEISPSEVFAQALRVRHDAQAIVKTVAQMERDDVDIRRRLKANSFGVNVNGHHLDVEKDIQRQPVDVFEQCLELRLVINSIREQLDTPTTPSPRYSKGEKIRPADVYLQTQLTIAELNLLKLFTGSMVMSPPTQPASGKSPTEVYAQITWARFALTGLLNHLEQHPSADVVPVSKRVSPF